MAAVSTIGRSNGTTFLSFALALSRIPKCISFTPTKRLRARGSESMKTSQVNGTSWQRPFHQRLLFCHLMSGRRLVGYKKKRNVMPQSLISYLELSSMFDRCGCLKEKTFRFEAYPVCSLQECSLKMHVN